MKYVLKFLAVLAMVACGGVAAKAAAVQTERFTVSLPDGFVAQAPQTVNGNTKWTYLREGAPGAPDLRFRVTVFEGSKPIPDSATGSQLAWALLVGYTAQQTKSFSELKFEAVNRLVIQNQVWWSVSWSARSQKVVIAGTSGITTACGAEYFLIFESPSLEEKTKVWDNILSSFRPEQPANQTSPPIPPRRDG